MVIDLLTDRYIRIAFGGVGRRRGGGLAGGEGVGVGRRRGCCGGEGGGGAGVAGEERKASVCE